MKKILQKIYYCGKIGEYIALTIAFLAVAPFYFLGLLIFWAIRPIVALSHFLMGNFYTAKDELLEFSPSRSLKDAFK